MRPIYLAGPITGLTYSDAADWRDQVTLHNSWQEHWVPLSPMRDKEQFDNGEPLPHDFEGSDAAVSQDLRDIDMADVVLVNLTGARYVSIGTMCELGYAYAKRKYIFVAMEHPYQAANRTYFMNPHDHIFVRKMASVVSPSLDEAIIKIKEWEQRAFLPFVVTTRRR